MCHTKNQKDHSLKVKRLLSNTDSEMNHTYYNQTRILKQSSQKRFSKQIQILLKRRQKKKTKQKISTKKKKFKK